MSKFLFSQVWVISKSSYLFMLVTCDEFHALFDSWRRRTMYTTAARHVLHVLCHMSLSRQAYVVL